MIEMRPRLEFILASVMILTAAYQCPRPACAQKSRGVVGIHRTKPQLAPPAIVTRLPDGIAIEGFDLPIFVSSPEKPGNRAIPTNSNSILIMSRGAFQRKTRYTVEVHCTFNGKPFQKIWSFRTR